MTDFNPVPTSKEQTFFDYKGTTYRVVAIKGYDAGTFTPVMAPIAQSVLELFQDTTAKLSKVKSIYDDANDVETTKTLLEKDVRASPPVPYNVHEVDGSSVLASDLKVFVAARDLDADSPDSLYEMQLRR